MPAIKVYRDNVEDTDWSDNNAAWWNARGYYVKNYSFGADIETSRAGYYVMWELNYIFKTGDYSGGNYNYTVPPAEYFYNGVVLWNRDYTIILQTVQSKQRVAPGNSIDLWTTDDKLWHFYFNLVHVPIIYTATFVYNYTGAGNTTATYTYNTGFTLGSPSRTGYTFSGWASNPNIGTGTSFTWTHAGNITFDAQWTGKTYTINYNTGDSSGSTTGSTASTSSVYPNSLTISTNGFTRKGYSFNGWGTSANGDVNYNPATIPHPGTVATLELYAIWTAKSYTLTFVNYIGLANTTYTVYYNNSITVRGGTRPGHNFVKFTSNFGDISDGGTFTWNRDSDETLTSVWSIIQYTVTFSSTIDTKTTTREVTENYGSSVTFPIFKAVGYNFLRWVNGSITYESIISISAPITLNAVWEKKENINFSELNRVYNGTRGRDPPLGIGANSISIGKFRTESEQITPNQIKLITHFKGKQTKG